MFLCSGASHICRLVTATSAVDAPSSVRDGGGINVGRRRLFPVGYRGEVPAAATSPGSVRYFTGFSGRALRHGSLTSHNAALCRVRRRATSARRASGDTASTKRRVTNRVQLIGEQ